MSTAALFTLEAYEHMASVGAFDGKFRKRVELIRGEILEMSPIGSEHCNCVTFLTEWSYQVVPTEQFMVRTQNPIRLPAIESEPEPDVVWVKRQPYSRLSRAAGNFVAHRGGRLVARLRSWRKIGCLCRSWNRRVLDRQLA